MEQLDAFLVGGFGARQIAFAPLLGLLATQKGPFEAGFSRS